MTPENSLHKQPFAQEAVFVRFRSYGGNCSYLRTSPITLGVDFIYNPSLMISNFLRANCLSYRVGRPQMLTQFRRLLFLALLSCAAHSFALELSTQRSRLHLSGQIRPGDAEAITHELVVASRPIHTLSIDSSGGTVDEAIRIAEIVKNLHLSVLVKKGGKCASACFFIFLAGDNHIADGVIVNGTNKGILPMNSLGVIGLHRPFFAPAATSKIDSANFLASQNTAMKKMSEYMANEHVPQYLIDQMMSHPSNDIYWLNADEIVQLGEFKPAIEELLISRCGYSRSWDQEETIARRTGDTPRLATIHGRNLTFAKCSVEALEDLYVESDAYLKRLKTGWRPWPTNK